MVLWNAKILEITISHTRRSYNYLVHEASTLALLMSWWRSTAELPSDQRLNMATVRINDSIFGVFWLQEVTCFNFTPTKAEVHKSLFYKFRFQLYWHWVEFLLGTDHEIEAAWVCGHTLLPHRHAAKSQERWTRIWPVREALLSIPTTTERHDACQICRGLGDIPTRRAVIN